MCECARERERERKKQELCNCNKASFQSEINLGALKKIRTIKWGKQVVVLS